MFGIELIEHSGGSHAITQLRAAFDDLKADPDQGPNIVDDTNVVGVTELGENGVTVRVLIKTKPGSQWGVGRAYNRLVKIHFDRAGIEIPRPHTMVYFGQGRDGNAPPARFQLTDDRAGGTPGRAPGDAGTGTGGRSNPRPGRDFDDSEDQG